MTDTQFLIIAGLLAVTVYQLWFLRVEQRRGLVRMLEAARRTELDGEIRRLCPNLAFEDEMSDLRHWQAVVYRVRRFHRSRKDMLRFMPHSGDLHSDEPSTWWEIEQMYRAEPLPAGVRDYQFPSRANDDEAAYLAEARKITEEFIGRASRDTVLTFAEQNYLTYQRWRLGLLGMDGQWGRPSSVLPTQVAELYRDLDQHKRSGDH